MQTLQLEKKFVRLEANRRPLFDTSVLSALPVVSTDFGFSKPRLHGRNASLG